MHGAPSIGEVTIHSGRANLWRSVEAVGGTLTLTNMRLHFRPHAFSVLGGELSIALRDIARVDPGNSLWVIPNQIVVVGRNGTRHKLVVWARDEWMQRVKHARSA